MGTLETNQTMYREIAGILDDWGWSPDFYEGWETRTNGNTIRVPTAVTVHHTGGYETDTDYLVDPADRPELVVLANVHITRGHKIIILAAGSTSHAGYGYKPNYDIVVNGDGPLDRDLIPGPDGDFSANTYTIGIEVDGAGGEDEWDHWMQQAVLAFSLAAQRVMRWADDGASARILSHKEFTGRKPGDPWVNVGYLRDQVTEALYRDLAFLAPIDGDKPPETGEPAATDVDFRFGQWNTHLEHFGGPDDNSPIRGEFMRDEMKCSVYALSECNEDQRDAIREVIGFKVWTYKTICVMWDGNKWDHDPLTDEDLVDFGGTPYHGAMRVTLTHKTNGRAIDVISIHVRPSDAFSDSLTDDEIVQKKLGDIWEAVDYLYREGHETIFAGDFATTHAEDVMFSVGFYRATPNVDTMDKTGDQKVDAIFITENLGHRDESLLDPGPASDHKAWVYNGTLYYEIGAY